MAKRVLVGIPLSVCRCNDLFSSAARGMIHVEMRLSAETPSAGALLTQMM